ncbi:NADP-dependent oxidoreductase [Paraurantiacibacter namhicola]|uniref:Putative NADP-dependent oxidoreductase YfmJ n=1 Tax=Paraurantiacibacter namhicola TaxID=645517 RepID=A0A1C7D4M4_9SPHN|nr:NADP-dependent oxidoreductase [Paraurantiacibacter namhicola]ANU06399.1 Putative NADP-dependent oxidoreductase YfmJ [Paraurantiacibacter namhicola]
MDRAGAIASFDALAAHAVEEDANCQWRIARRPVGNVEPEDFEWRVTDIPEPGEGEVLLKTLYLGLAPVMRFYMQGTARTGDAGLEIGDVIHGRGVAQVVKSRHPGWREGEIVQGQMGWQTWKVSAMTAQEKFFRMPKNGLPAALGAGVLGMTGLSAHAGFFACGDPKPEDRMVLSGAAGGVGSMVAQMAAKVVGCDVVGMAGGPEKCDFIRSLGCSEAIDYRSEDIPGRLDALRPDGIDLYFDNVGGETLEAVLERLRMHARVVLCGSISEYTRDEPFALPNYTRLRATDSVMRGFFVYNHLDRWDAVMEEMAGWITDGRLKPVQDIEQGFAAMPRALARLYHGGNVGVQCCSVRGEPEEWL